MKTTWPEMSSFFEVRRFFFQVRRYYKYKKNIKKWKQAIHESARDRTVSGIGNAL